MDHQKILFRLEVASESRLVEIAQSDLQAITDRTHRTAASFAQSFGYTRTAVGPAALGMGLADLTKQSLACLRTLDSGRFRQA